MHGLLITVGILIALAAVPSVLVVLLGLRWHSVKVPRVRKPTPGGDRDGS